jgi:hypothetical protein
MSSVNIVTRGERELALRFDTFPQRARQKLVDRMTGLVDTLRARVESAAPRKTGRLRSEIQGTVYADNPNRVAGYVQVVAGGDSNEYAKAAALEYGTDKPRRALERTTSLAVRLGRPRRRLLDRISKPANIDAFRYLRGPIEAMRGEVEAELSAALDEAARE